MARVYELAPDNERWAKLNSIEATHIRMLPGVRCPTCGTWSMTGIIYPSVNLSLLDRQAALLSPWPIPFEDFSNLAGRIEPILGAQRPATPGAELGPLRGKAKGNFGDFAWVNPWTPLLRESIWIALKQAEIHLVGVHAELRFGKEPHETLVELEALPKARLPTSLAEGACPLCGRLQVKRADRLILDGGSLDHSVPLQRIAELPTVLVANERFAEFIQAKKLRDVILTSIELC